MSFPTANKRSTITVTWPDGSFTADSLRSLWGPIVDIQPPPETCASVGWFGAYVFDNDGRTSHVAWLPVPPLGPSHPELDIVLGPDSGLKYSDDGGSGFLFELGPVRIPNMGLTHVTAQGQLLVLESSAATICVDGDCSNGAEVTIEVETSSDVYGGAPEEWPKEVVLDPCWTALPVDGSSRIDDLPACWRVVSIPDCDTSVPGDSALVTPED